MKSRHSRLVAGAAGLAALGAALGLLVPLALAGGDHATAPARAAAVVCQGVIGPQFPLEMNTVTVGTLVKTVAMEKEIFNCQNELGQPVTRDHETFVEIVEREDPGPTVVSLAPRVLTAICDTTTATGNVACKKTVIAVKALGSPPFIPQDCFPAAQQPADPVEMNSVNVDDNFVKTIKVDKTIYNCNDSTLIGDLYVFTELVEAKTAAGDNFALPSARFVGVFCLKSKQNGDIIPTAAGTPCVRFTPTALP